MARPHIEPYVELNDPFRKFDIAGFRGSHYKVLSLDLDTGACTLKLRFDGGYKRKPVVVLDCGNLCPERRDHRSEGHLAGRSLGHPAHGHGGRAGFQARKRW